MTGSRVTERDMLNYLHQRYTLPTDGNGKRWATAEHVKDDAGFFHRRVADFIAVDCWPSGGIELHGHEVKVSRSDWLAELKHPEKSEAFKRYMDRWWLVVPDTSIVHPDELPEGWGLQALVRDRYAGDSITPARDGFKLRAKIAAPRLTPEPLPRTMLATLLRATAKTAARQATPKPAPPLTTVQHPSNPDSPRRG